MQKNDAKNLSSFSCREPVVVNVVAVEDDVVAVVVWKKKDDNFYISPASKNTNVLQFFFRNEFSPGKWELTSNVTIWTGTLTIRFEVSSLKGDKLELTITLQTLP